MPQSRKRFNRKRHSKQSNISIKGYNQKGGSLYKFNIIYKDSIYPIQISPLYTTYNKLYKKLLQEIRGRISNLPKSIKIVIPIDSRKLYIFNELVSDKLDLNIVLDPKLHSLLRSSSKTTYRIPVYVSDAKVHELDQKFQSFDGLDYPDLL